MCPVFTTISFFFLLLEVLFTIKIYLSLHLFSQLLLKNEWFVSVKSCYLSAGYSFKWLITPHVNRKTFSYYREILKPKKFTKV